MDNVTKTPEPTFAQPDSGGVPDKPPKGTKRAWKAVVGFLDSWGLTPKHVRFWGVVVFGIGLALKNPTATTIGGTAVISGEISAAKRGESAIQQAAKLIKPKGGKNGNPSTAT